VVVRWLVLIRKVRQRALWPLAKSVQIIGRPGHAQADQTGGAIGLADAAPDQGNRTRPELT
jgi:hypothetical protein